MPLPFRQVDVFSSVPLGGNPVAVVHATDGGADDLDDVTMQAFARWTNLSETTFLLPPTDPAADYRLRIFTPGRELPFAGHPTLGSAHAWLEAGGVPRGSDLVQECGVGLVRLRRTDRLAFAAPPLTRSEPADPAARERAARALGVADEQVLDARYLTNGPDFLAVRLPDAATVLALRPDLSGFGDGIDIGVVGPHPDGAETALEVRVFVPSMGIPEDPVTGSFNAAAAEWLIGDGTLPSSYVAAQGSALGRTGRVHVDTDAAGTLWVGGDTLSTIVGDVTL